MSKVIKISNGEVHIREIITRGLKKTINKAVVENAKLQDDGSVTGLGIDAIDRANDAAAIGMTEKIIIDGKDVPVSIEAFDNMEDRDFELVRNAIKEIDKKVLPNI